ncbi:MAG: peptidase C13 [Caulobacteraceae bacterium]|nr:MAG: peptidase C13 [Caulobacteraceae bacterium]
MRRLLAALAGLVALGISGSAPAAQPSFRDWAAVVVAGDFAGAHNEGDTEAFDNARRDISQALVSHLGFSPQNILQFSVRPDRYPDTRPGRSRLFDIHEGLAGAARKAKSGCLFYFTSHGLQYGAFLNSEDPRKQTLILPQVMAELVDSACPGRPSVVIISTCFSGVNVPALQDPNRLIMTAASKDRSSFGCGQQNTYPYFDDCFLQSVKAVKTLAALPPAVTGCVSRMERETGASPPSQPQVWVGPTLGPMLMLYAFPKGS